MTRWLAIALLLAGCAQEIDPDGLPTIDGYDQWYRIELTGEVALHGSGCRAVFVNDVGRAYTHAGRYQPGTVIVKESYGDGDCVGDPEYLSVMRRFAAGDPAADGLPLQDEWLFTDKEGRDGSEEHYDMCFQRCHRAAPWDGAWYDYGAP